jgi:hypothetical protein
VVIATGVAWGAYEMVRGGLVGITLSMITLGSGFGICWAFLAKRVIGGAPVEEQPLASAAVPTTQLIGGATGAAAAGRPGQRPGLRARGDAGSGLTHGLWLFARSSPWPSWDWRRRGGWDRDSTLKPPPAPPLPPA